MWKFQTKSAFGFGIFFFLSATLSGWADGKVMPASAYPLPDIPEQQALIHYANGIEKLVIQTTFNGQGTNFAWIVPLPSVPKIEAVSSGVFPTLQFQVRPEVRHNVEALFGGWIALASLVHLLWKTRGTGSITGMDALCCLGIGGGLALLGNSPMPLFFVGLPTLLVVSRVRSGTESPLSILLLIFVLLLLGSMLLPALSSAGGGALVPSVVVHERNTIGNYDTAVISAKKADELMKWLGENGFATPPIIAPVIADYIKDGWVFAAIRLARNDANGAASIHPLMFTFPSKRPVYPMRLTGAGNGNLKVDLFVFGSQRAKAAGFKAIRCAQVSFPKADEYSELTRKQIPIGHPGLSNIVSGAAVATKLRAVLTPDQLKQDIWIDWEPFQAHREIFYSRKGAWFTALNYVAPWALIGLLALNFNRVRDALGVERLQRSFWGIACAASLATSAFLLSLPQIEVHLSRFRPYVSVFHRQFQAHLFSELSQAMETNKSLNVEVWLNKNASHLQKTFDLNNWLNPYSGQPYKQEDSPGNFRLKARTNGFDYVWYDINGFEDKTEYP